jgi:hypothetical protein
MVNALSANQQRLGPRVTQDVDRLVDEHFPELERRFAAIREEFGAGIVTPYSIPAQVGLEFTELIDSWTRELVVVGQNLYGLIVVLGNSICERSSQNQWPFTWMRSWRVRCLGLSALCGHSSELDSRRTQSPNGLVPLLAGKR